MAVYTFQISMPVDSGLARDRYSNTIHMDHVGGVAVATDLDDVCDDLIDLYQSHYGAMAEVRCKAYTTGAGDQGPPKADRVKNLGSNWITGWPRELAVCLSFAANPAYPSERGRIYLAPDLKSGGTAFPISTRPDSSIMDWALNFYKTSNDSFPDIGGIDWKFGVWSVKQQAFKQSTRAWVDDEWDTVRRRGLRASTRVTSVRDG